MQVWKLLEINSYPKNNQKKLLFFWQFIHPWLYLVKCLQKEK